MLNGKLVSLVTVLESVYASSAFLKGVSPASAAIWAGEAMDLIGAPTVFRHKVTDGNVELEHPAPITVEKFRGVLPFDLYKIDQVRSCKTGIAYRLSTNTFHEAKGNYDHYGSTTPPQGMATYTVSHGYILGNKEEDVLEIAYTAFPMDKDGMPLIPDDEVVKLGIGAYIKYKAYLPQWELGTIPDKVMEKTEQDYDWRIGGAISRARTPNADGLESMKNIIVRLIPKISSAHSNFFENMGASESLSRNFSNSWNSHP